MRFRLPTTMPRWAKRSLFVLIPAIVVLIYFANTRFVSLSINASQLRLDQDADITIEVRDSSGQPLEEKVLGFAGKVEIFMRLPNEARQLIITAARSETLVELHDLKMFASKSVSTKLINQVASSKIAKDSLGCALPLSEGRSYSYSCHLSESMLRPHIYRGNDPHRGDITFYNQTRENVTPYGNGFMQTNRINEAAEQSLEYVDIVSGRSSRNSFLLPADARLELIVDRSGDGIMLVDHGGSRLYFFEDITDDQPTQINLTESVATTNSVVVSDLIGSTAAMYVGLGPVDIDDEASQMIEDGYENGHIITIDFTQANPTPTVRQISRHVRPTRLILLSESSYLLEQEQDLTIFMVDDDNLRAQYSLSVMSPNDLATSTESVYIVRDNGIYELLADSEQAHLLYREPGLQLSSLNIVDGEVYFSAFISRLSPQELHGFRLSVNQPAQATRLESLLPYSSSRAPVRNMDYYNNQITIQLLVTSYISNHQTGRVEIDQAEFERLKAEFIDLFESDGLELEDYDIKFTY